MFNAQELIDSEIRTVLIGSAWRLHYEHTWSGLNFGLWNPPCYCESRNPQVFLARVVPLTTIYIFEDINWSAKATHCKTRLVFPPTKAQNAEILLEGFNDHFSGSWMYFFDYRVSSFFEQPCPWVEALSVPKPKEFVDNKSETNIECSHRFELQFCWNSLRVDTGVRIRNIDILVCPSSIISSATKPKW